MKDVFTSNSRLPAEKVYSRASLALQSEQTNASKDSLKIPITTSGGELTSADKKEPSSAKTPDDKDVASHEQLIVFNEEVVPHHDEVIAVYRTDPPPDGELTPPSGARISLDREEILPTEAVFPPDGEGILLDRMEQRTEGEMTPFKGALNLSDTEVPLSDQPQTTVNEVIKPGLVSSDSVATPDDTVALFDKVTSSPDSTKHTSDRAVASSGSALDLLDTKISLSDQLATPPNEVTTPLDSTVSSLNRAASPLDIETSSPSNELNSPDRVVSGRTLASSHKAGRSSHRALSPFDRPVSLTDRAGTPSVKVMASHPKAMASSHRSLASSYRALTSPGATISPSDWATTPSDRVVSSPRRTMSPTDRAVSSLNQAGISPDRAMDSSQTAVAFSHTPVSSSPTALVSPHRVMSPSDTTRRPYDSAKIFSDKGMASSHRVVTSSHRAISSLNRAVTPPLWAMSSSHRAVSSLDRLTNPAAGVGSSLDRAESRPASNLKTIVHGVTVSDYMAGESDGELILPFEDDTQSEGSAASPQGPTATKNDASSSHRMMPIVSRGGFPRMESGQGSFIGAHKTTLAATPKASVNKTRMNDKNSTQSRRSSELYPTSPLPSNVEADNRYAPKVKDVKRKLIKREVEKLSTNKHSFEHVKVKGLLTGRYRQPANPLSLAQQLHKSVSPTDRLAAKQLLAEKRNNKRIKAQGRSQIEDMIHKQRDRELSDARHIAELKRVSNKSTSSFAPHKSSHIVQKVKDKKSENKHTRDNCRCSPQSTAKRTSAKLLSVKIKSAPNRYKAADSFNMPDCWQSLKRPSSTRTSSRGRASVTSTRMPGSYTVSNPKQSTSMATTIDDTALDSENGSLAPPNSSNSVSRNSTPEQSNDHKTLPLKETRQQSKSKVVPTLQYNAFGGDFSLGFSETLNKTAPTAQHPMTPTTEKKNLAELVKTKKVKALDSIKSIPQLKVSNEDLMTNRKERITPLQGSREDAAFIPTTPKAASLFTTSFSSETDMQSETAVPLLPDEKSNNMGLQPLNDDASSRLPFNSKEISISPTLQNSYDNVRVSAGPSSSNLPLRTSSNIQEPSITQTNFSTSSAMKNSALGLPSTSKRIASSSSTPENLTPPPVPPKMLSLMPTYSDEQNNEDKAACGEGEETCSNEKQDLTEKYMQSMEIDTDTSPST
ncbi:serine-rich adhesin for platelets-like [Watersipora subatra]|uniref:serine-rich adhesin for platelets-like n=1 Tax=Watersipora subatra TaxID=2589382 RepID=UPI00355B2AE3